MREVVEQKVLDQLAETAAEELVAFVREPARERAKRLAKAVLRRGEPKRDMIFWPAGMLCLGLAQAGRFDALGDYVGFWKKRGCPIAHVDDAVFGQALLIAYERTGDLLFKDGAERIADYLRTCRRDPEGMIVYNQAKPENYIFADGAGQTALFLCTYGRLFENERAVGEGLRQIGGFLARGFDAASGLPYHGFDSQSRVKHGIIGWGRGTGWLMMGMAGAAALGRERGRWSDIQKLCSRVLALERKDHLFSWQLEAVEGPGDTSATGMLLWAMLAARKAGVPDLLPTDHAVEIALALQKEINGGLVYGASGECIDFGMYSGSFGPHPWGQGAVLAALALLNRTEEGAKP